MKTSASTISSSLTTIPPFIKMRSFWACKTTIKRRLAGEFHTHSCTCAKWNSSAKKTSCSQHGYYKTVSYKLWFKLSALISFFFFFCSFLFILKQRKTEHETTEREFFAFMLQVTSRYTCTILAWNCKANVQSSVGKRKVLNKRTFNTSDVLFKKGKNSRWWLLQNLSKNHIHYFCSLLYKTLKSKAKQYKKQWLHQLEYFKLQCPVLFQSE